MKEYDVVVVGSGASGSFMAYEFTKLNSDKKVCVIDAGRKELSNGIWWRYKIKR